MATSLEQLILFRVMQGLAGGGLQPSSQGVLLDAFPPEKQGAAMTHVRHRRPARAGRRADARRLHHRQLRLALDFLHQRAGRRCGLRRCATSSSTIPTTCKQERAELRKRPLNFDYIGLGLLAIAMVVLGNRCSARDRSGTGSAIRSGACRRWRSCFVLGSGMPDRVANCAIANPVVNFRPLAERNFAVSCIIIFCAFGVLYGTSTTLPALLQSLFGYDAYHSGLVLSPAGLFSVMMLLVVGTLLGRGVDAR